MKRVLFVCSGNICRSPMAEVVFREMARRRRLTDAVDCESAGTNVFAPNSPVHNGTVRQLRRENIQGKQAAYDTHYQVGKKVRQTIQELGGTMPEDLPTPQKSIAQIEREQETRKLKSGSDN